MDYEWWLYWFPNLAAVELHFQMFYNKFDSYVYYLVIMFHTQ